MRGHRAWVAASLAATLFVSGCAASAATPTASSTAAPTASPTGTPTAAASPSPTAAISVPTTIATSPTPTFSAAAGATASASSVVTGFYLRSWSVAPVGPENSFGNAPAVISNGQLLSAIYSPGTDPYPLFAEPMRRTISQVGLARIVTEAQNDGLLGPAASFVCPHGAGDPMMAGTATDYLVLTVGGATHEMSAACPYQQPTPGPGAPAPATWAAFERFTKLLSNPAGWLGAEAGPQKPYDPTQLAVLVVPSDVSTDSAGPPDPANVVRWPLVTPFASFGIAAYGDRCAVVSGSDEARLLAVGKGASATAVFLDGTGAFAGLIVRAFMPGESDPCHAG